LVAGIAQGLCNLVVMSRYRRKFTLKVCDPFF
jgi:hypothetical protein